jgi:hypothetical protein
MRQQYQYTPTAHILATARAIRRASGEKGSFQCIKRVYFRLKYIYRAKTTAETKSYECVGERHAGAQLKCGNPNVERVSSTLLILRVP